MNDTTSILITGATGFIGQRLLSENCTALVRKDTGCWPKRVVGDLLYPESLKKACRGIHTVIHCAGYAHAQGLINLERNNEEHWRVNFEGTKNLLYAAVASGVEKFVFLSSVKAFGEAGPFCVDESWLGKPSTAYGKAKRAAEKIVFEIGSRYGIHVVCLRLAMVYGSQSRGNMSRLIHGVRSNWCPPIPETGNKRSLVHIQDVIKAVELAVAKPEANGKLYIVADKEAYSGRVIYNTVRDVLGKSQFFGSEYPAIPESVLRLGGKIGDRISSSFGVGIPLNSDVIERLLGWECYSPAKIRRELRWEPEVNLLTGLEEMVANE